MLLLVGVLTQLAIKHLRSINNIIQDNTVQGRWTTTGSDSSWDDSSRPTFLANQSGSWIEGTNTWVPPAHWKLFSAAEMRKLFREDNWLILGDSTMRRAGVMLHDILHRDTHADLNDTAILDDWLRININRGGNRREWCHRFPNWTRAELPLMCRPLPVYQTNFTNEWHFHFSPCWNEVDWMFENALLNPNSFNHQLLRQNNKSWILLIGMGIWEYSASGRCVDKSPKQRDFWAHWNETWKLVHDFAAATTPNVTIVWRTTGFAHDAPYELALQHQALLDKLNHDATNRILDFQNQHPKHNLIYVDWGEAIKPRSFGAHRIKGDIQLHYGFDARMVALQQLANVIADHRQWR